MSEHLNGCEIADSDAINDIATDEQLFQAYGKPKKKKKTIKEHVISKVKAQASCSGSRVKDIIHTIIPITHWLPRYDVRNDLFGDIIGGITVGIVNLPQGMAYASLANLPPVVGLYVSFFPALIYAVLGTTNQLSVGTFAVVSLMIGATIEKHAPPLLHCSNITDTTIMPSSLSSGSGENEMTVSTQSMFLSSSCEDENQKRKIAVAVALSVAVAIIHFAMYIARLGFVTIFLSNHMVSGFTCGAAFHVVTSQVPSVLGIYITKQYGILSLIKTYILLFENIKSINLATVIMSACCIFFLMIGKEVNLKFKKKLPFPIPWELVVVIFTTIVSEYGFLKSRYNVKTVEAIPQGIRMSTPSLSNVGSLILDAIPIAVVIFSISVSLSAIFSVKHGYKINPNQELLAYAVANLFSSFFSCFPCAASLSRSVIWDETGGKTQITGIISSIIILITLLWIGPLFESLPFAALASIILVNLKTLLYQFNQVKPLWRVSKIDCIAWVVSWLAVVLLGVDLGLLAGVVFCLLTVIFRTLLAQGDALVQVGQTDVYRSSREFCTDKRNNRVLIFKFFSPLYYANRHRFETQVSSALGFEPAIEAAKENNLTPQTRPDNRHTVQDGRAVVVNHGYNEENELADAEIRQRKDDRVGNSSTSQTCKHRKLKVKTAHSKPDLNENCVRSLTHLILDMAACSFIDNDGIKAIKSLFINLSKLNIRLLLAHCASDVRKSLQAADFPPKPETLFYEYRPVFFISLQKASEYADADTVPLEDDRINEDMESDFETAMDTTRV